MRTSVISMTSARKMASIFWSWSSWTARRWSTGCGTGAIPLPDLLKIGIQIAEALETAHRAGIVHRDLKPGNVMRTKAGARLMDFGLAKPMLAPSGGASAPLLSAARTISASPMISPLTTAGTIVGTIQYMSAEQIEGKDADARADIFAFGALLYEMATGKRAFEGKNQISVASAITATVGSIVRRTTFGCAGNELTCDAFSPPFASPTH
jgi:serine/threonine protein kinase